MIYKKIKLENDQTLAIFDLSRKIGADAFVVLMKASMEIKIEKGLFADDIFSGVQFEDILEVLGERVTWEHRVERNFIMDKEKDEVFDALLKTFLDNLGQYVASPKFPGKFILKEYKDRIK